MLDPAKNSKTGGKLAKVGEILFLSESMTFFFHKLDFACVERMCLSAMAFAG
jgi:hypothetical protein